MGTDDKTSLIVLRDKRLVESYVDEIMREDMPARIVIDNITIDNGMFVLRNSTKYIVLETPLISGEYPEQGKALVTFAGSTSLYKFQAEIISIDLAENRRMRFTLQFPDKIVKQERRKHVRVKPPEKQPVIVRLSLADDKKIDARIADISQGGISLMITESVIHFKTGDTIDLVIHMPRYDKLSAVAIIRNIIHLMDLTRIGAEFSGLTDRAVQTIIDYVTQCETLQPEAYEE